MQFSYCVKGDAYWELVSEIAKTYGYPRAMEELAIYSRSKKNTKVIVRPENIRISWRKKTNEGDLAGVWRRNRAFSTATDHLKQKLEFIFERDEDCDLSTTPLLLFDQWGYDHFISLRESTLIGPLLSIEIETAGRDIDSLEQYAKKLLKPYRTHLLDDLNTRVSKLNIPAERCFVGMHSHATLNTKILSFCKRNGIINPLGKTYTYDEVQNAKSNDYSMHESVYRAITNAELLSANPLEVLEQKVRKTVSFIIPFYNSSKSIERTLLGVLGQKNLALFEGRIEIIIVEDGSSEPVLDAIKDIKGQVPIKIVRLMENSGVSHAREVGLTHAVGDILIFLDSDVIISENYLYEHYVRNVILNDCVFVSFKQNMPEDFALDMAKADFIALRNPDYGKDLRLMKKINPTAVGVYNVERTQEVNILEETNYFKDFHGARKFGVYDLASMVIGHNFSGRRETFRRASPFARINGWGMEDTYMGLRMIASGSFFVPVMSCGVYHIDHPPRSGSEEAKRKEYKKNSKLLKRFMKMPASRLLDDVAQELLSN